MLSVFSLRWIGPNETAPKNRKASRGASNGLAAFLRHRRNEFEELHWWGLIHRLLHQLGLQLCVLSLQDGDCFQQVVCCRPAFATSRCLSLGGSVSHLCRVSPGLADAGQHLTGDPVLESTGLGLVRAIDQLVEAALTDEA